MKAVLKIVLVSVTVIAFGCQSNTGRSENVMTPKKELSSEKVTDNIIEREEFEIDYVVYGYYFGECVTECAKIYKHILTGEEANTLWVDKTDSYFKRDRGLVFESKTNKEAEKIAYTFLKEIPKSVFDAKKSSYTFGCPDCDDGGGLYFEFRSARNKGIVETTTFNMEYGLNETSGDIKKLGELIKETITALES